MYCICLFRGCDVINLEINLIFLIKPVFCMTKRSRQDSSERKELLRAIWKSWHWHLGTSIGIDVSIGIALQKIYFVLRSLYFWFSKFYMKKTSMVKYLSSTLADRPGSFRRCLEQLFCRKPVSACFWRKELHSRRYFRSFKNTQGLKLHFAGL